MNLVPLSPHQGGVTTNSSFQRCEVAPGDTLFAHEFAADPETVAVASLEQSSDALLALARALGIVAPAVTSAAGRTIVTEVA